MYYRYFFLFLFFWLLAFIAYYPAHGAQFIYDHNMWAVEYERLGWRGIYTQWGEPSIHYIFQCTYFILYKLLRWHGCYWTLLQTAWHATNATLLYVLVAHWSRVYQFANPKQVALWAALFFLLSPYHTEVLVWGAAIEYMIVTSFMLGAIICFSRYLQQRRLVFAIATYVLYILALLTWELALIFPAVLLLLYFLSPYGGLSFRRFLFYFFIPMALLLPFYFLLGKWTSGTAIAHYGAAVHLNFSPSLLIPNLTRFILKLFDLSLLFSFLHSVAFIDWLRSPLLLLVQVILYSGLCIIGLRAAILRKHLFWALMVGLAFISLIPLLNLYFAYFTYIESDRYVYLSAAFFYAALSATIFFLPRLPRHLLLIGFLLVQVFFLHRFVYDWRTSGRVVQGLVQGFQWQNAHHIYVLATPDAMAGAWCLRSQPPHGISLALLAQRHIDIRSRMSEVLQYEMMHSNDSCHAEKIAEATYHFAFTQYGDWFIKCGMGVPRHWENDEFIVDVDEWNMSFVVKIKNYQPADVVLYQVGGRWIEIK